MRLLRLGLLVFFLLVVLEGAIRKWLLPDQQQIVYIVKDVWLLFLVIAVAASGHPFTLGLRGYAAGFLLPAYSLYVALASLNSALPSLTLGLWGLRSHVLYASLVWLIPTAVHSSAEVMTFLRRAPVVAVPIFVLGIVQFFTPANSILNRYAAATNQIAAFGDGAAARVTGTFPYISGMVSFVFLVFLLCLIYLLAGGPDRRQRIWLTLALGAAVTPMTGTRWLVFIWAIVFPLLVVELMLRVPTAASRLARFAVGVAIVGFAVGTLADSAMSAFSERASKSNDAGERLRSEIILPVNHMETAGWFGFGAGSTHQAAATLVPDQIVYGWLPTRNFEGEPGRLVLELGVIGFLLAFALKSAWIALAHRAIQNAITHDHLVIGLAAIGFFAAHFTASTVFNATASAFYWGLAGVLVVVVREQQRCIRS